MKKIIPAVILFVVCSSTSYAQGKYQQKQNDYFVEAAAKEFNLDDEQKIEISKIRMEMVNAYMSNNKSFKAGDITQEAKKSANRDASKTYHTKLAKLTGKTYKEIKPWLDKMRNELKKVK